MPREYPKPPPASLRREGTMIESYTNSNRQIIAGSSAKPSDSKTSATAGTPKEPKDDTKPTNAPDTYSTPPPSRYMDWRDRDRDRERDRERERRYREEDRRREFERRNRERDR